MHKKIFATLATAFFLVSSAHASTRPPAPGKCKAVAVEITGTVPGFTQPQLSAYLTRILQESAPCRFDAEATASAPNRIVWKFRTLKMVWKGGSHNGFPSQDHAVSYLSAEVKLYLKGEYQMTMEMHPSVLSGDEDHALAVMARHAAQALFVENKP